MPYTMLLAAMLSAAPQATTVPAGVAVAATTTTTAPTERTFRGTPVRADTRVCVRTERAGSFIAAKTCRSYAQWLRDGTDPLATKGAR
ncbi:hypothetical protein [Sphingomonas sp. VNH70]|uniref:hypothetical protein n=1 Tax=Sphingomonas silueang TaxID=3156617 RepID=UPI0032B563BD